MNKYFSIEEAEYIHDYTIKLIFNDGRETEVDFSDFIKKSHHPDIAKYQDLKKFKKFHLTYGDLEWNDFELSFPINDLYQGKILH